MTIDIKPVAKIISEAAKQSKDRKPITKADVNNAIKALQRLGEENNSIIYRLNYLERAIKNISSITIDPSMPIFINSYELQGGNGLSLSIDTINKIIDIDVGQGDGLIVSANSVEVDCTDLLGDGIDEDGSNNFMVDCTDLLGDGIDEDGNNNFMVDCTDLLGWGITEVDNNFTLDASINPTWTGNHIFEGTITLKTNMMPGAPDTYDIGSSTVLWRKAYISELEALIFAENTIFPIGGWFMITKDQGSLPTEMSDSQTTYDFGKSMTTNDILVFRAAGVVEYIQIGSLITGTTYNITRNLDGTGANTWVAGSTWACLGYNGNGRIELNAYDTPRINLITQGTAYNNQAELLRIGDLNGNWGYSSATYGLAIGEYGSGKVNLTIDPTNGYRLRTYSTTQFQITPNLLKFGADISSAGSTAIAIFGADQTYNSESVGTGDLLIGDNSSSKANILWDKSVGKLLFRGGTTTQFYIDTDGSLVWGNGEAYLNATGIKIRASSGSILDNLNSYKFFVGNTNLGGLFACVDNINNPTEGQISLRATGISNNDIVIYGDTVYLSASGSVVVDSSLYIDLNSTTALVVEQDGVKDNVLVVDTTNGRVGINCQPQFGGLHVVDPGININYSGSTTYRYRIVCNNTQEKLYISYYTTYWYPDSSNPTLTLTYDGKIGIRNIAPSELLDVAGNINISGEYKIGNTTVVKSPYYSGYANNNVNDPWSSSEIQLVDAMRDCLIYHGLFKQTT